MMVEVPKNKAYTIPLCNMEFDPEKRWIKQPSQVSPCLPVVLSLCRQAYVELKRLEPKSGVHGKPIKRTVKRAVGNTGAQLSIIDMSTLQDMGIDVETLILSTTVVKEASAGSRINIAGVIIL